MRKLSECIMNGYAACPNCGEVFVDDMLRIGMVFCPNEGCLMQSWVLQRHRTKEEAEKEAAALKQRLDAFLSKEKEKR